MTKSFRMLFVCSFLLFCVVPGIVAAMPQNAVVYVYIRGEIDAGQAGVIVRALEDAKTNAAHGVIIELDTFGGLVDSAVTIRDAIVESSVPTVCYIKNRAWSAGALIALANQHILIAPGGSIGAAEPIPATEKNIAALKAEFAATAAKTGRNPKVAEAMVDKTLGFPGYASPGQILALTDQQAIILGYGEKIASSREEVIEYLQWTGLPVVEYGQSWQDRLIGWLNQPMVRSLLITIIFLAVLTEVKTAGTGVAAFIGLLAALLFFWGQWMVGTEGFLPILLFVGGIVLLAVELHAPGIGIFGVSGAGCILLSFFLALGGNTSAITLLAWSLIVAIGLFLILLRYLPDSPLWNRLVLHHTESTGKGFVTSGDYQHFYRKTGIAVSPLRPAGIAEIEGEFLNVVSDGLYIEKGTPVVVIEVVGSKIVVQPMKK